MKIPSFAPDTSGIIFAKHSLFMITGPLKGIHSKQYRDVQSQRTFLMTFLVLLSFSLTEPVRANNFSPLTPMSYGFYKPESPQIPAAVRRASQSVVEIIATEKLASVETEKLAKALDHLENNVPYRLPTDGREELSTSEFLQIYKPYLALCLTRADRRCPVPSFRESKYWGSGVLVDSGKSLLTTSQTLEGSLHFSMKDQHISSLNQLIDSRVPLKTIFIFNDQGELIFHPLSKSVYLESSGGGFIQKRRSTYEFTTADDPTDFDFVQLRFDEPLGQGLSPSPLPQLKDSDQGIVYLIGFPYCTECDTGIPARNDFSETLDFTRAPYPNAAGDDQRITMGLIQEASPSLANPHVEILKTTCDANHRMVGGALVNFKGELLGILSQTKALWNDANERFDSIQSRVLRIKNIPSNVGFKRNFMGLDGFSKSSPSHSIGRGETPSVEN